ncbi:MAG: VWA domain-containing protein [Acidobacteriota bacterium]|nr:MAG: VWA domain-containing protein [Acidobacteriota bacterium]
MDQRIDLEITVPSGSRIKIETTEGAVTAEGEFRSIEIRTLTGTIAANVGTEKLSYSFEWTGSRPRYSADIELPSIRERAGGRFEISGNTFGRSLKKGEKDKRTDIKFSTARGIILLNVPPNEVANDLRDRPLTNAAKAIVRSGDSLLMEAIRRSAPRYYGEYARSLPPVVTEPRISRRKETVALQPSDLRKASIRFLDMNNRSVEGMTTSGIEIIENGERRDIVSVQRSEAPFNLILLLDVSGSVDRYMTFIRKAARSFLDTVSVMDRVSIVTFAEDVKVLSGFTTDRTKLSSSLDSFDAGGGTAFYDALAYTLAETLRAIKGERTAIVVLTDGDDNRSFLAFDTLLGPIEESGAVVYPLYVPSGVMASADLTESGLDPLRERYLNSILTDKAKDEGPRLASVSGGVFYNITQLSEIQTAYDDIVKQLRGSYEITYRSSSTVETPLNRIRIRSLRPNTFVQVLNVESVR